MEVYISEDAGRGSIDSIAISLALRSSFLPAPPMASREAPRGRQAPLRVLLHHSPVAVLPGGPLGGGEETQPDGTASSHGSGRL